MVWKGRYLPPGTFTLKTVANAIHIGSKTVYLPKLIWAPLLGRVEFVQTALPEADDTMDVDLRVIHPIFGEVFAYQGRFRVARYVDGRRVDR